MQFLSLQPQSSPCASCALGCCHRHTVNLGGYDAWLIARGLGLAPGAFLRALPLPRPAPGGFLLDRAGPHLQLALAKRPTGAAHEPCVFLEELPDRSGRCAIYPLRPLVCRTYPAYTRNGLVGRRDDVLCPEDAWRDGALDAPGWYADLARQQVEHEIYALAADRWNFALLQAAGPPRRGLDDYLAYLFELYDRLEPLRAAVPDWERLCAAWEGCLDKGASPLRHERAELRPWQAFLDAVRAAVHAGDRLEHGDALEDELERWEAERAAATPGPQQGVESDGTAA